jgi:hypothetical protein
MDLSPRGTRGRAVRLRTSRKGTPKSKASAPDDAGSSSARSPTDGLFSEEILDTSAMLHLLSESLNDGVHLEAVPEPYSLIVEHANRMTPGDVAAAFHLLLPTLSRSSEAGTSDESHCAGTSRGTATGSGENRKA